MGWFRASVPQPPPTPRSALSKLFPLILLLIILSVAAYIGYQLYLSVQKISAAATDKLGKKNVVFTKDGMRVGVKEVKTESYVNSTQGFLVKAWNLSTWPEYKSMFWNKPNKEGVQARTPYSRTPSSST